MKRLFFISGICFVLTFLSVSVCAFDNATTERAIDVLQTLQIINEDYDTHIAAQTGNVTRAEFAYNAAKIFASGEKSDKLYFHDVPRNHWAFEYISALVDKNIILVDENARFKPDEYILKTDAVKILLRGLGYGTFCDEIATTDIEILKIAKRAGILDNVSNSQNISSADMFLMLYNSLMAETLETNSILNGEARYMPSGQTCLEQNFSSYMKIGVLEGYDGSALSSAELDEDKAIISGEIYEASEFDLSDMIGLNIMYLYKYEKKIDKKTIIWASIKDDKDRLNLEYEENSVSFDVNNYILIYYDDNDTRNMIKVDKSISLIYNGEFTDKSIDVLLNKPFKSMTLVKNKETKLYDVAIITAYENYLVSGIDYKEKTLYDKISHQKISFDSAERVDIYSASGTEILFEDIKNDDVVSVFRSLNGDRVRIVVSDTAVEGIVTAFKNEAGYNAVIIDGIKYRFKSGVDSSLCKVKTKVNLYLDAYGYIAYAQTLSHMNGVAYVLSVGYRQWEDCIYLEMLDETGNIKQVKIDEKIEIDGESYKDIKQAFDVLGNKRQLICYRTNINEEIISIDTEAPGKENKYTSLHKVQDFESVLYKSWGMLGNKINVDGNTVIFCIPNNVESADREEFGVKKMSDLKNDTWYNCGSYAVNERIEYDEILVIRGYDWNVPNYNLPGILVSEKGQMLNDEDIVVDYVEGQRGNERIRILCSEDYSLSKINPGDFIIASINSKGEITSAKIEYSPISENIKRPSEPLSNVACIVTSGYVSDVIGNMVYIGYENSNNHDCTFNFNLGTVLIYDTENNKIEKGSVNDMISGKVSGGEGSLVLAQFNWMMPIVYVIYK